MLCKIYGAKQNFETVTSLVIMDRGRVGYDAVGNKYVREAEARHRRVVQLERLEKILHRKPGSSATLDNTRPVIIQAMLNNPRKLAVKRELADTVERENKAMLRRIGKILTAPPKITDDEYKAMRKLCPSLRGIWYMCTIIVVNKTKLFF